ncbi:hypothetical protein Bca52824_046889 [Brassica carinata]|uniref:Uncharacterized protein n=1 Tax=Brassica carinata TaxID=52824 RepID=A0A8X7RFJ7_BRACI|nr:hypothetical protein Bca52824_046889 [Brassica carinata]
MSIVHEPTSHPLGLASNVTAHNGYFNGSIGLGPTESMPPECALQVLNLMFARCIETTSEDLLQTCPNKSSAFSWSAEETLCLVRYSSRSSPVCSSCTLV